MDPARFVFLDETGTATNLARAMAAALRRGAWSPHRLRRQALPPGLLRPVPAQVRRDQAGELAVVIEPCAHGLQLTADLVPSEEIEYAGLVVEAYQAMRGASFLVAVTVAAEIGDLRRFDNPRQLMAFLGLVPRERSTGDTVRRAGLTLAGNRRARRVLVEAAWSYRHRARVSETLRARLEGLPKPVRDTAWKAQIRLCARYRRRRQEIARRDRCHRP